MARSSGWPGVRPEPGIGTASASVTCAHGGMGSDDCVLFAMTVLLLCMMLCMMLSSFLYLPILYPRGW